jgi:hypothetical protein
MAKKLPEAQKLLDNLDNMAQEDFEREFGTLLRTNPSYNKSTDFDSSVGGIEPIDQDVSKAQPKEKIKESSKATDLIKPVYTKKDFGIKQKTPLIEKFIKTSTNDEQLESIFSGISNEGFFNGFGSKINMEFAFKIISEDGQDTNFQVGWTNFDNTSPGLYGSQIGWKMVIPSSDDEQSYNVGLHELGHLLQDTYLATVSNISDALQQDKNNTELLELYKKFNTIGDEVGQNAINYEKLYSENYAEWQKRADEPKLIELLDRAKQEAKELAKPYDKKLKQIKAFEDKVEKELDKQYGQERQELMVKRDSLGYKEQAKNIVEEIEKLKADPKYQFIKPIKGGGYEKSWDWKTLKPLIDKKWEQLSPEITAINKRISEIVKEEQKIKESMQRQLTGGDTSVSDLDYDTRNKRDNAIVGSTGRAFADFMSAMTVGKLNGRYRLSYLSPHPVDYYNSFDWNYIRKKTGAEMFANYIVLRANPDKSYLEYIKKQFPSVIKDLENQVNDIETLYNEIRKGW